MRPKIISGDDARTVAALARQAGLDGQDADGHALRLVTGPELDAMGEDEVAGAAASATLHVAQDSLGVPGSRRVLYPGPGACALMA